jgi:hypothetical protein
MDNNKTKIILVVSIVLFIAMFIGNLFWYLFIHSRAVEIVNIEIAIREEQSQNHNLKNLKENIVDLEEKNKKINEIFIDKNNIVLFIEKIERMASAANVALQIKDVKVSEDSDYVSMVLQTNGTWPEVRNFLDIVESMPHKSQVELLRFSRTGDNGWSLNLSLTGVTN